MLYGFLAWAFLARTVNRETLEYLAAFLFLGIVLEDWTRRGLIPAVRWFAREVWRYRLPLTLTLGVTDNWLQVIVAPFYCLGLFSPEDYTGEYLNDVTWAMAEAYLVFWGTLFGGWAWRGARHSLDLLFRSGKLFLHALERLVIPARARVAVEAFANQPARRLFLFSHFLLLPPLASLL